MIRLSFFLFVCIGSICQGQSEWREVSLQSIDNNITYINSIDNASKIELLAVDGSRYVYNGQSFSTLQEGESNKREYIDSMGVGPISKVTPYQNGQLIATINNGLWLKEGQTIRQFNAEGFEFPIGIFDIEQKDDELLLLDGKNSILQWNTSTYDAHNISMPIGEYISDIAIDVWGQLWLLGEDALFVKEQWPSEIGPILYIEKSEYKFSPIASSDKPIEFDSKDLILSFSANSSFLKKDEITYAYRLKYKGDWFPLEGSHVNLTNLAPGDYEFQFRAKAGKSDLSYSEMFSFYIKQNFWNTIWPWLFGVLSFLLLLWLFSYKNQQQKLSTLKNSANKYRLENQLLKSKQETKQLQMNPHFLFNSLNTIQGLIAQNKNKEARSVLVDYAALMRLLLNQSREDNIEIEQEIEFLSKYLQLEKTARNDSFNYNIRVNKQIEVYIKIPPMILQPILENAIIHGMKGISYQGEINIEFEENDAEIIVTIEDNGIGRQTSSSQNVSHGTTILKERLQSYLPLSKQANIQYIDKQDGGKAKGTTVITHLPKLN